MQEQFTAHLSKTWTLDFIGFKYQQSQIMKMYECIQKNTTVFLIWPNKTLNLVIGWKSLTAPNATDSIVCIRASSIELSTPFLLSRARPANVQKRTCLIPTDTKCVSESGRNSATKILWVWPIRLATLAPEKQKQSVMTAWISQPWWDSLISRVGTKFKGKIYFYLPATSRWSRCVQGPGPQTAGVFLWH